MNTVNNYREHSESINLCESLYELLTTQRTSTTLRFLSGSKSSQNLIYSSQSLTILEIYQILFGNSANRQMKEK